MAKITSLLVVVIIVVKIVGRSDRDCTSTAVDHFARDGVDSSCFETIVTENAAAVTAAVVA